MSKVKASLKQYNLYLEYITKILNNATVSKRMNNLSFINLKNECPIRKTNTANNEKSILGPNKK